MLTCLHSQTLIVPCGFEGLNYTHTSPTLLHMYPRLIEKLRILLFSGDVDECVPYNGAEEWVSLSLARFIKSSEDGGGWGGVETLYPSRTIFFSLHY